MKSIIRCRNCAAQFSISTQHLGRKVKCAKCGQKFEAQPTGTAPPPTKAPTAITTAPASIPPKQDAAPPISQRDTTLSHVWAAFRRLPVAFQAVTVTIAAGVMFFAMLGTRFLLLPGATSHPTSSMAAAAPSGTASTVPEIPASEAIDIARAISAASVGTPATVDSPPEKPQRTTDRNAYINATLARQNLRRRMAANPARKPTEKEEAELAAITQRIEDYEVQLAKNKEASATSTRNNTPTKRNTPTTPLDIALAEGLAERYVTVMCVFPEESDLSQCELTITRKPNSRDRELTLHIDPGTMIGDSLLVYTGGIAEWTAEDNSSKSMTVTTYHTSAFQGEAGTRFQSSGTYATLPLRQVCIEQLLDDNPLPVRNALIYLIDRRTEFQAGTPKFQLYVSRYQNEFSRTVDLDEITVAYEELDGRITSDYVDAGKLDGMRLRIAEFRELDENSNGVLTSVEFGSERKRSVATYFEQSDFDRNGVLSLSEFLKAWGHDATDLPEAEQLALIEWEQEMSDLRKRQVAEAVAERQKEQDAIRQELKAQFIERMNSRPADQVEAHSLATLSWVEKVLAIQNHYWFLKKYRSSWYTVAQGKEEEVALVRKESEQLQEVMPPLQAKLRQGIRLTSKEQLQYRECVLKSTALAKDMIRFNNEGIITRAGNDAELLTQEFKEVGRLDLDDELIDQQVRHYYFIFYKTRSKLLQAQDNVFMAATAGALLALPYLSGGMSPIQSIMNDARIGQMQKDAVVSRRQEQIEGLMQAGFFVAEISFDEAMNYKEAKEAYLKAGERLIEHLEIVHPEHHEEIRKEIMKFADEDYVASIEDDWLEENHPAGIKAKVILEQQNAAKPKNIFDRLFE